MQEAISDFDEQFMMGPENSSDRSRRARVQRSDDFDCTLCLKMLYDPVTTPCEHSFCRACLFQSMDHGKNGLLRNHIVPVLVILVYLSQLMVSWQM